MSNSSIWPIDRTYSSVTTLGQSGPGSDRNERGTLHFPKLQHYWSLTIRLFSIISRTQVWEVLPLCRDAGGVFYNPIHLVLTWIDTRANANSFLKDLNLDYIYIYGLSKFLRQSLLIFIIKVFQTMVFIFIVISTTFRPICPPSFFRCLSNSGTFMELRTTTIEPATFRWLSP